ncbi:hypothetical protein G7Y89_g6473 [Cudoniella acicularis]|uniref:NACHT domain-containing protein n=1 Tax=Cudoniella acicularis TaxID=354080 RepID=A0A8H4RM62_9HELO|nr:hypothetical protein G7Y89_g6473 [Cudoniella acicularis]
MASNPVVSLGNDDPWTLAKNRFLADLDESEAEIFHSATLENLYYGASNVDREDSRKSNSDYERIFDRNKHQRLTQALADAYLDIIILCTQFRKTIRNQKNSAIRRVLKPLSIDTQLEDAVERFRQHRQNVEEEARTCDMIEAADERNNQLLLLAAERRRKLLSRLSNINCQFRHRRLRDARHPGTGIWLTEGEAYRNWVSCEQSSILCCYGIPGCGKSVLASSVIDSFGENETSLFYYCDYADKRTLEVTNVFGTLARQVLEKVDILPEDLAADIESADHDGERLTSISETLEFFRRSLELLFQEVFIVLDGLDEASESPQMVICDSLRGQSNRSSRTIKLFLTGREDLGPLLRPGPEISYSRIMMSSASIAQDIESYVRASTRKCIVEGLLVIRNPDLEELIVLELVKRANGMFLWVEFQLYALCEPESDHEIRRVLRNLPRTLRATYDRLLAKIEGQERKDMIQKIFKWVVCARQPLHVDELREGIAFTIADTEWNPEKIASNFNRLVRACSNLLVVDEETQIVQLAHHTVHQYLLEHGDPRFHFTMDEANNMAGEFCIAYLNFSNFDSQITRYKETIYTDMVTLGKVAGHGTLIPSGNAGAKVVQAWNLLRYSKSPVEIDISRHFPHRKERVLELTAFSFLSYAITNWIWHTASFKYNANNDTHRRRDTLFKNLIHENKGLFKCRPWDSSHDYDDRLTLISLLGWAFMANHGFLIEMAFSNKDNGNDNFSPGDFVRQGWEWLFSEGTSSATYMPVLMDMLNNFSADSYVMEKPEFGWLYSRFLYACRKGHLDAIQMCAFEPSRIFEDNEILDHLTVEAAAHGHLPVVIYCLETNNPYSWARSDSPRKIRFKDQASSALERAIIAGHSEIVQKLVSSISDNGSDAGQGLYFHIVHELIPDEVCYYNLLSAAIDNGKLGVIQSLLYIKRSQRAFLPFTIQSLDDPKVRDSFLAAIQTGRQQIIQIIQCLLEQGVGPNAVDNHGETALIAAIKVSNVPAVRTLLQFGCYLGNTSMGMPLTIAACFSGVGSLDICKLLIQHKAEIFPETFEDVDLTALVCIDNEARLCLSPTPLYMACYYGNSALVRLLLTSGAAVNFASPRSLNVFAQVDGKDEVIRSIDFRLQNLKPVPTTPIPVSFGSAGLIQTYSITVIILIYPKINTFAILFVSSRYTCLYSNI